MTRDKLFLGAMVSFLFGVLSYPHVKMAVWVMFLLAGALAALSAILTQERAKWLVWLCLGFMAGMIRFSYAPSLEDLASAIDGYEGKKVSVTSAVAELPQVKNGRLQLVLEPAAGGPPGKILVMTDAYADYAFGERVEFEGTLKRPPSFEGFDYEGYLFRKGIYFVSYYPEVRRLEKAPMGALQAIYSLRKRADGKLKRIMPAPEGSLLSAMTLGVSADELKGVMEDYNKVGTSHIVVVSGSHLVIVIAALMYVLLGLRVNRKKTFWWTVAGAAVFIMLSGSGVSAIRSGLMIFVFLLAARLGREKRAVNALVFSAAVMVWFNPYILASDVSFQLSFLATMGLIALAPRLPKRMGMVPEKYGLRRMLSATLAAQLATLPVIVMNFGQVSLLSLVANLLLLPTVPFVMAGGFLLVGLSFASMAIASAVSWPIYALLCYQLFIAHALASTDLGLIRF